LSATFKAAWNNIFAAVAPLMIHEVSEKRLKSRLKSAFDDFVEARIREDAEQDLEDPRDFRIDESDFQTIKIQLRALGLITRSEKTRSVKDVDTYWALTPYGDELMTRLRATMSGLQTKSGKTACSGFKVFDLAPRHEIFRDQTFFSSIPIFNSLKYFVQVYPASWRLRRVSLAGDSASLNRASRGKLPGNNVSRSSYGLITNL
jgi:hypothetical protein